MEQKLLSFLSKSQNYRLPAGGLIDRKQPIKFTFDGKRYWGFVGDTLASALLANGVKIVGRSFKFHRPRGVYAAGADEPNALVQLETFATTVPNVQATQIELYEALVARSQNNWPSLRFDFHYMRLHFEVPVYFVPGQTLPNLRRILIYHQIVKIDEPLGSIHLSCKLSRMGCAQQYLLRSKHWRSKPSPLQP